MNILKRSEISLYLGFLPVMSLLPVWISQTRVISNMILQFCSVERRIAKTSGRPAAGLNG